MKFLNFITVLITFFSNINLISANCPFTKEVCNTCEEFGILSSICIENIEKECCGSNNSICENFICDNHSYLTTRELSIGASGNDDDVNIISESSKTNPDNFLNKISSFSIPAILYCVN